MHAQLAVTAAPLPFFLFASSRFCLSFLFSGTLVAHRCRRRCRRTELMASRRPNLIHRRLLAVYTVAILHGEVYRNFSSPLTQ